MNKRSRRQIERVRLTDLLNYHYKGIGMNTFKWTGLPEYIKPQYPERWLYEQGMCTMMKPKGQDDLYILPVKYGSLKLDPYGDPLEWQAYAVAGTSLAELIGNQQLDADNSVLIWNDAFHNPSYPMVDMWVKKMVRVECSIDTNVLVQQMPIVFRTSQNETLDGKNTYEQIVDQELAIFKNKSYDGTSVEFITPNIPFLADKLSDQYMVYDNRILEYFGIPHLPVEKQERMLTGEVDKSDSKCLIIRESRLNQRKLACKKMNEIFGLNVEVEFNEPDTDTSAMSGAYQTGTGNGQFED